MTRFAYVCKFCIYAKFAYVRKSDHVYAFSTHACKICTYAKVGKFAPASDQVQISFCVYTKFAYMQILSCEQKTKFAHVSIYLIVLYNCWNNIVSRLELFCLLFNLTKSCASLFLKLFYQSLIKFSSYSSVILAKYCNFDANIQTKKKLVCQIDLAKMTSVLYNHKYGKLNGYSLLNENYHNTYAYLYTFFH